MAVTADKVIVRLEAKVDQYMRDMARSQARFDRNMSDMRRSADRMEANVSRSMRKASASAGQMSRDIRMAVSGVALGLAIREVTQYADAWTEAGNKIAAAGTPLDKQGERLSELADLAIDTRSAFDATASLYARLGIAAEDLTGKSYDLLKVTELINKATVAGGASTGERNSTVLQLSQALASGELMGEELRSLRENAPILLRAIAKEFEVPIGALKELGAEGKLTSERILEAILNAEGEIAARFAKTDVTIGDSLTNLRTRVTEYVGSAGAATGASATLADAINHVANNVEAYGEALVIALAATTAFGAAKLSQFFAGEIGAMRTSIALHNARIEFLRSERLAQQRNAEATVRSTQARIAEIKTTQSQVAASMSMARSQKAEALAYYELQRGLAAAGQGTGQLTVAKANLAAASRTVIQLQRLERGVAAELTAARAAEAAATTTAGVRKEQYNAIVARTGIVSRAAAAGSRILSGALALVGGPVGLAILGFTALTALIVKFTRDANRAAKEVEDNFNRVLSDADAAIEAASNYVDPFREAGESASWAERLVADLTASVRDYTDALNDATVAKFIQDADDLQRSIADTRGEIARLEAEREKLLYPSQAATFGARGIQAAAEAARPERLSQVNQDLGALRAKEAGLEQYQASIAVNVIPDDFMAKFIRDPQGAIDELTGNLPETKPRTSTGGGKPDKGTVSAIRSIEDAWAEAFMTKRQLAEKDYQDTLTDIEGMKTSQAQKDDLAQKALELRDKELKDIRQEELDGIQAVLDARDSAFENEIALINRQSDEEQKAIAAKVEDTDEAAAAIAAIEETRKKKIQDIKDQEAADDQALIDQVLGARAQALGDYEALAEQEYQILKTRIEKEISAEQGKYALLEMLRQTHEDTINDIRDRMAEERIRRALEEAETIGEGFRAQWDYMRSEAEHATAEIGMLFADTFGPGGVVQTAIGDAVAQAVVFGDSFEESIGRAAQAIAGELVSALVSYGVQMAAQTLLGQSLGASATAASIAQGAATAAAWAPAAAAVSLASFGANAAPAQAGIASTYGLTAALSAAAGVPGFEQGGYTGNGGRKDVAGVVHGKEFVLNADATARNRNVAEMMNRGVDFEAQLARISQPVSIHPSFMASGRTINIAGSSIVFNGPVDRDTAPQFKAMLDQQRRDLTREFEKKIEEHDTKTTPRHERNRFLKG